MGITVPQATLPSGVQLNNVYMSFGCNMIQVTPRDSVSNIHAVTGVYSIYSDSTKENGTEIHIPILAETQDMSQSVYTILYNKLKTLYPGSTDC